MNKPIELSPELIFPVNIHEYGFIWDKISIIANDDIPEIYKRKISKYKQQNQSLIADKPEQQNRHQNRITDKIIPDKTHHSRIP